MLESYALRKIDLTPYESITPKGFLLGNGQSAIDIVLCESSRTFTKSVLDHLWKERNKGRPAPVLFLVEYDGKVALFGSTRFTEEPILCT